MKTSPPNARASNVLGETVLAPTITRGLSPLLLSIGLQRGGFAALYLAAVALLFASRVREFADETDNLLGGLLITRGERLYVDFFSSHMPVPYYVAAFGALLGAISLEQFRLYSSALLVLATLGVVWAFRARLSLAVLG